MQFKERPRRSILKALSYRCLGTLVTVGAVFWQTRGLAISLGAGAIDFFAKILLFYGHERIWNLVSWGRREVTPAVIWFTGLSGAGKSTLAEALRERLRRRGYDVELLDGDLVRDFFRDTGFSREERLRHLKCMGFIAAKLESHGTIVLASFITPFEEARAVNRGLCRNYIEVHVSTSLADCERRDPKGLYRRARSGELPNFTGISAPFETPTAPEITIDTSHATVEESLDRLIRELQRRLPSLKAGA